MGDINTDGIYRVNGVPLDFPQTPWKSNIDGAAHTLYNVHRIGVGLSSPHYSVDVLGDVNVSGHFRILGVPIEFLPSHGAAQSGDVLTVNASGNLEWRVPPSGGGGSADQTPWLSNISADGFTLNNAGSIGIGKSSPAFPLDVVGDVNITGQFRVNGQSLAFPQTPWTSNIDGGGFNLSNVSRVGIGIQNPQYALDVDSASISFHAARFAGSDGNIWMGRMPFKTGDNFAGNYGMRVNSSIASRESRIEFTTQDVYQGTVGTNGYGAGLGTIFLKSVYFLDLSISGDLYYSMRFFSGSNERMRLTAAGRLGIGMTAPGYALDVAGDVNIDAANVYRIGTTSFASRSAGVVSITAWGNSLFGGIQCYDLRAITDSNPLLVTRTGATNSIRMTITADTPTDSARIYSGQGNLTIQAGDPAPRFLLLNPVGGNVGIGTQTPAYTLDVKGDVNITGQYRVNGVPLSFGGNQTPWTSDINAAGYSLSNITKINGTTSTESPYDFNITSSLNVTLTPAAGWFVNVYGRLLVTGYVQFQDFLTVGGYVNSGGCYRINSVPFACPDNGGIALSNITTINGVVSIWPSGVTIDNPLVVTGSVGVGVSSPAYKLDVAGDVNITGVYRINGIPLSLGGSQTPWTSDINGAGHRLLNTGDVGIGTNDPQAALDIYSIYEAPYGNARVRSDGNWNYLTLDTSLSPGGGGIQFMADSVWQGEIDYWDGNIQIFTRGASNNAVMNLTSGGNIGIGNSNPDEKLDISGNIHIRNNVGYAGIWLDGGSATRECFFGMDPGDWIFRVYSAYPGIGNVLTIRLDSANSSFKNDVSVGGWFYVSTGRSILGYNTPVDPASARLQVQGGITIDGYDPSSFGNLRLIAAPYGTIFANDGTTFRIGRTSPWTPWDGAALWVQQIDLGSGNVTFPAQVSSNSVVTNGIQCNGNINAASITVNGVPIGVNWLPYTPVFQGPPGGSFTVQSATGSYFIDGNNLVVNFVVIVVGSSQFNPPYYISIPTLVQNQAVVPIALWNGTTHAPVAASASVGTNFVNVSASLVPVNYTWQFSCTAIFPM